MANIEIRVYLKSSESNTISYLFDEEKVHFNGRTGKYSKRICLTSNIHGEKILERVLTDVRNLDQEIEKILVYQVDSSNNEILLYELSESKEYDVTVDIGYNILKINDSNSFYTEELNFSIVKR